MVAKAIRGALIMAAAAALVCGVAGCGGPSTKGGPPNALVVNVTISKGQVTPTNATLEAKVGAPITFDVTSDAPDELHVHSTPDHKFEVAAAPDQKFEFKVDVPGAVEVELHHLDRTVATIQVRP
jgi:plastocyanin